MFQEINPQEEAAILAAAETPKRGKKNDYNIRTVTQWFKLPHQLGEEHMCNVPEHEENVPEGYSKDSRRATVAIGNLNVCRWCFIAGAGKD